MNKEDHDYGMAKGHSPVADKVVCVDYDGTIFPWGPLISYQTPPIAGAVQAVKAFAEAGFRVVIFTSRMSPTWLKATYGDEGWEQSREYQRMYIETMLDAYEIPFDDITCEKVPAVAYVDDKALTKLPSDHPDFTGGDWATARDVVLSRG